MLFQQGLDRPNRTGLGHRARGEIDRQSGEPAPGFELVQAQGHGHEVECGHHSDFFRHRQKASRRQPFVTIGKSQTQRTFFVEQAVSHVNHRERDHPQLAPVQGLANQSSPLLVAFRQIVSAVDRA